MEFLKSLCSHLLAFIMFIVILLFSVTLAIRGFLTYDNTYKALENSHFADSFKEEIKKENQDIPDEFLDEFKYDDIVYDYVTNVVLYEFKRVDEKPHLNVDKLYERINEACQKYVDKKIDQYTGNISAFLEAIGLDFNLSDEIKGYIDEHANIDFSDYIELDEEELDASLNDLDEAFQDPVGVRIVDFISNDTYLYVYVGVIISILLLIALINFNIISSFAYSIAPLVFASISYLVAYSLTVAFNFEGTTEALLLNSCMKQLGVICLKSFIILLILAIVFGVLYYLTKHLNIMLSHKKGVATLDTVFDDYNSDEVVKEISRRERENEEKDVKKKETKNTKKKATKSKTKTKKDSTEKTTENKKTSTKKTSKKDVKSKEEKSK